QRPQMVGGMSTSCGAPRSSRLSFERTCWYLPHWLLFSVASSCAAYIQPALATGEVPTVGMTRGFLGSIDEGGGGEKGLGSLPGFTGIGLGGPRRLAMLGGMPG